MPDIDVPALTIFSTPGCVQCNASERHAKAKNIPYQKIDVTEFPDARELVMDGWGYKKAPVLYFQGKHVLGFDVEFLAEVQEALVPVAA